MKQLFANNVKSTLASPIANTSVLTMTLVDASNFPTPGANEYYLVTVEAGEVQEVFLITSKSSNTLTATSRGVEGTLSTFAAGSKVEIRSTAGTFSSFSKVFTSLGAGISSLVAPNNSYYPGYITTDIDTAGANISVIANSSSLWDILGYTQIASGTTTASSSTSVTCASVASVLTAVSTSKYILQLSSGTYTGYARLVSSVAGDVINWSTALPGSAGTGITIIAYRAISDILNTYLTTPVNTDDAIIMSIVLGGD